MKTIALVTALACSSAACHSRGANSQIRYTGVVLLVGGGLMIAEPSLNGDGFDAKLVGIGSAIAGIGAALLIGSLAALPSVRRDEAIQDERRKKYEANLQAVELLHKAEAAAAHDDCPGVVTLAPQIDVLDAGVGAVLRSNVAANRCLNAPK